jgi:hypothetical protein
VVDDVYVAQAGENYYSIRFEPNLLTPTIFVEKEPFILGEKLKWHDYIVFIIMTVVIFTFSPIVFESRTSNLGIFTAPLLYFIARYISLSNSTWKRTIVWTVTGLLVGIELYFLVKRF